MSRLWHRVCHRREVDGAYWRQAPLRVSLLSPGGVAPTRGTAAEIAEAAAAQGKFWEMYNALYQNQKHLSDANIMEYAKSIGLDIANVEREMNNSTYTKRVEEDLESGDQSGVEGTPTFYINGVYYDGAYNVDAFQAALEQAMQK